MDTLSDECERNSKAGLADCQNSTTIYRASCQRVSTAVPVSRANQSFKLGSRIREPHGREASGGLANPAAYASRLTAQMETLISPVPVSWRTINRNTSNMITSAYGGRRSPGLKEIMDRSEFWRDRPAWKSDVVKPAREFRNQVQHGSYGRAQSTR